MLQKTTVWLVCAALFLGLAGCAPKDNNQVIIYASAEDFRAEHMRGLLKEGAPSVTAGMGIVKGKERLLAKWKY